MIFLLGFTTNKGATPALADQGDVLEAGDPQLNFLFIAVFVEIE
jgi:hypothetical protein